MISTVTGPIAAAVILCIVLIPIVVLVICWCYKNKTSGTYRVEEKEKANKEADDSSRAANEETTFNSRKSETAGSNKEERPESLMANKVAKE